MYVSTGRVALDSTLMPAVRRLGFYILLLNFRGWVLYLGFNTLEDAVVRLWGGDEYYDDDTRCWYRNWLRDDQPECAGRAFDFSDHIVLYFAQILPIALVEFLHSWEYPYWTDRTSFRYDLDRAMAKFLPLGLVAGMCYLYVITSVGVYRTAYYFHTGPEVFAGFAVSLVVHAPLCWLSCSPHGERAREYLFQYERTKSLE